MAETQPTWVSCQDPTCYTPQDMRLHDSRIVCSQGVSMRTGDGLLVTQNVVDPLCVDVASGGAWIAADLGGDCQGIYGVHNCGVTTVCADDGDPTDPRIDRVVFQVNDSDLGGIQCDSELEIVTGTPSPSPVPPPEPDNAVTLAFITVTASGITVIQDARVEFETCGSAVTPDTGWLPLPGSVGSPLNLTLKQYRVRDGLVQVRFVGSLTAGIPVNSEGNITDIPIGTLPVGVRPGGGGISASARFPVEIQTRVAWMFIYNGGAVNLAFGDRTGSPYTMGAAGDNVNAISPMFTINS